MKPMARKFTEFVDLILARLYEAEQSNQGESFFDLNEIARGLKARIPEDWIFDAGKVLESRGLAQVTYFFGGGCLARLTGEGRMYVEEERGSVIRQYHQDPNQFVVVVGDSNQVAVTGTAGTVTQTAELKERRPAFEVLDRISEILQQDRSLEAKEKEELLADVEAVRGQFKKREPNRAAIAALLEPLSQISSIAAAIASLVRLLTP